MHPYPTPRGSNKAALSNRCFSLCRLWWYNYATLKGKSMKIVINEDTVGELSDDGEITTDDIWLMKLANKIRRQKLTDLRTKRTKQGHYSYLITVKKGDPATLVS